MSMALLSQCIIRSGYGCTCLKGTELKSKKLLFQSHQYCQGTSLHTTDKWSGCNKPTISAFSTSPSSPKLVPVLQSALEVSLCPQSLRPSARCSPNSRASSQEMAPPPPGRQSCWKTSTIQHLFEAPQWKQASQQYPTYSSCYLPSFSFLQVVS